MLGPSTLTSLRVDRIGERASALATTRLRVDLVRPTISLRSPVGLATEPSTPTRLRVVYIQSQK